MRKLSVLFLLLALVLSCSPTSDESAVQAITVANDSSEAFEKRSDYWYQGKAELNTYTLQQNRYNALHPGEVVAIFVTEDFLTLPNVRNYDGSWTEYGSMIGVPIER